VAQSYRAAVLMFVGRDHGKCRDETIFLWSIDRVRDPGRVYEIYLMKELAGFDHRGWLTGFTNYRFAIPHFAGGSGRASYKDVDQRDFRAPGPVFATQFDGYGVFALS